jgi:hypothetical protein
LWELWKTTKRTDGWYACWGGRIRGAASNGVFPQWYGVAGSGLPLLAGLIRVNALQQGGHQPRADHCPAEVSPTYASPANRSDGSAGIIPEGQRFRIDHAVDLDALR